VTLSPRTGVPKVLSDVNPKANGVLSQRYLVIHPKCLVVLYLPEACSIALPGTSVLT
jgi:hypothetical protein